MISKYENISKLPGHYLESALNEKLICCKKSIGCRKGSPFTTTLNKLPNPIHYLGHIISFLCLIKHQYSFYAEKVSVNIIEHFGITHFDLAALAMCVFEIILSGRDKYISNQNKLIYFFNGLQK